ncbi:LPS export ABC transporter permease LptG [Nevskia soli]|uniref:LPS export ABC transporter permease LptG n=1 Tax=Nevskia soli TaxID=418856 RepID=UPI0004A6F28F|nr:LPS export ABC transporter permease LptG [Nevskia soli]
MINRLDRYVISHVLQLTGIVALGLVSIYTLVVFVSDVNETGKGSYGVLQVLEYSLLMIPSSLYILMPIVALLGTLMGIGALSRSGELTAMRSAGVSLSRIGGATLIAGAGLAVFAFFLGDWLAPTSEAVATELRDSSRGSGGNAGKSVWLRDADRVVRISKLQSEDHIGDVTVFRLGGDGRLEAALTVDEGVYADGHWRLSGVKRTDFADDHTTVTVLDQMDLGNGISPNVLKLFILEAGSLSAHGLVRLIGYMDENHLDASKYRLLLWRKLTEPLTVMVMMLFAVPFVIGQLRDAGAGQKLLAGALVGIVFYVVNKVSVSLGDIYQWPAPLAAGLPTLGLALLSWWRLSRSR